MLAETQVKSIVQEIEEDNERNRRAAAKRRVDIYRDGGRPFLIERILREFGRDALAEMRVTPINLLKKIVDKRAGVYKRPPSRKATNDKDQALVDYYVKAMNLDVMFQKANRYVVLSANTVVYVLPKHGKLCAHVVPNYLYSIIPNQLELTKPDMFVFSSFVDEGRVAPDASVPPATGVEGFSEDRGFKFPNDLVASREQDTANNANRYIFWSAEEHFTTDFNGNKFMIPEVGPEQFQNPIGLLPVINVARDRDNETWATQGEDMVDLTIAIQMGWTDLMTIAKHQGFGHLLITGEEKPAKMLLGPNHATYMKSSPNGPAPTMEYVNASPPLAEYKELLTELLGLLLTTNNMEPGAIGGNGTAKTFTSGFHALISMADSLEAIESDKPLMEKMEQETWAVIAAWHNWMFDTQQLADEEAKALGKFSNEFQVSVSFADVKPLESEDERIARVKSLLDLGLLTKLDAIMKLHPGMTQEQAQAKLDEIKAEKESNMAAFQSSFVDSEGVDKPADKGNETPPEQDKEDENDDNGSE